MNLGKRKQTKGADLQIRTQKNGTVYRQYVNIEFGGNSGELFVLSSFIRLIWAVLGSRNREITSIYQYNRLKEV